MYDTLYSVGPEFTLVNSVGEAAGAGEIGLLLYNGGTVCDDSFDDHAAAAICAELEFSRATQWTSRHRFSIQYNYEITLDDVKCSDDSWENCDFSESHNCEHSEDVFLACANDQGSRYSYYAFKRRRGGEEERRRGGDYYITCWVFSKLCSNGNASSWQVG